MYTQKKNSRRYLNKFWHSVLTPEARQITQRVITLSYPAETVFHSRNIRQKWQPSGHAGSMTNEMNSLSPVPRIPFRIIQTLSDVRYLETNLEEKQKDKRQERERTQSCDHADTLFALVFLFFSLPLSRSFVSIFSPWNEAFPVWKETRYAKYDQFFIRRDAIEDTWDIKRAKW